MGILYCAQLEEYCSDQRPLPPPIPFHQWISLEFTVIHLLKAKNICFLDKQTESFLDG